MTYSRVDFTLRLPSQSDGSVTVFLGTLVLYRVGTAITVWRLFSFVR